MTKVIRVKNSTFDSLTQIGKWTDTMDDIISRLIKSSYNKEDSKTNSKKLWSVDNQNAL
jgi:hypothetical protein